MPGKIRTKGYSLQKYMATGCLLALFIITACAGSRSQTTPSTPGQPRPYRVNGIWYQPIENARDFIEYGKASWYGKDFHGRRTSNGEIYDMYAMTAAHKTLPLGTYVRVHNLDSNHTVDVRVNDRGPFVRGRIIDLSYAAAKTIKMVGPGTAKVKIQALGAPAPTKGGSNDAGYLPIDYYSGNFTFQVGAFTEKANAERLVNTLRKRYLNAHMTTFFDGSRTFYRVRVGQAKTLEEAEQFEQRLSRDGYQDTLIVAE